MRPQESCFLKSTLADRAIRAEQRPRFPHAPRSAPGTRRGRVRAGAVGSWARGAAGSGDRGGDAGAFVCPASFAASESRSKTPGGRSKRSASRARGKVAFASARGSRLSWTRRPRVGGCAQRRLCGSGVTRTPTSQGNPWVTPKGTGSVRSARFHWQSRGAQTARGPFGTYARREPQVRGRQEPEKVQAFRLGSENSLRSSRAHQGCSA